MAKSEIITLVHSAGNKNNNNNNIKKIIIINNNNNNKKINVGQQAKLAARPAGILPVLPMASPPLLLTIQIQSNFTVLNREIMCQNAKGQ